MKKALILLSALLLTLSSYAAPVKRADAEKIASKSFKGAKMTFVWDGTSVAQTKASSSQEPDFYVFNSDRGGFIIISAEDAITPVIAYSKTGSFKTDNMPENLKEWMGLVSKAVGYARSKGLKASNSVKKSWDIVRSSGSEPTADEEKAVETALWDQGAPYNGKSPTVGGGRSVTGCVATAAAIMMRNRKFPSSGTGTIPGYSFSAGGKSYSIPAHDLGHTYDWENMPMKVTSSATDEQKEQIATLMYDLGTGVQMTYSPNGSSAVTGDVINVLADHMGYDKAMVLKSKESFSDKAWYNLIKNEINTNGPTMFAASDIEAGGHAFVADGYACSTISGKEEYYFHFNWGWSGSGNAFYSINALDVDDLKFSERNVALIGAAPDKGGEKDLAMVAMGFTASASDAFAGNKFSASFSFHNNSGWTFSGSFGVGIVSKTGEVKEVLGSTSGQLDPGYYYSNVTLSCAARTTEVMAGDRISVVFKDKSFTKYKEADMTVENPSIELTTVEVLEKSLSMEYDKTTSRITVSAGGVTPEYTLKDSAGNKVTSGVSLSAGVLTIDYAALAAGEYSLSIVVSEIEKTVTIKK